MALVPKGRQDLPGEEHMVDEFRLGVPMTRNAGEEPPPVTDLELLAQVVDAECRAWREDIGYHYDSRCLDHYSDAIARLGEEGAFAGGIIDDEVVEFRLQGGLTAQARRVRSGYVKGRNLRADRPKYEPSAAVQAAASAEMQLDLDATRAERDQALAMIADLERRGLLPAAPEDDPAQ